MDHCAIVPQSGSRGLIYSWTITTVLSSVFILAELPFTDG
jgi:hypothetical protein